MKIFHLELPPLCNQECIFCIISAKRRELPLNLDVAYFLKKAISETQEGDTVFIAWGEPTYWNNIDTLFRAILKMKRFAYVVTNGSDPEKLAALIHSGMNEAVFSFFAFDAGIHAKITGAPYFSKLIESLELFKERKKNIHLNVIVTTDNQGRILQDIEKLVSNYPIAAVTFQLLIPLGKWTEVPLPDLNVVSKEVNEAISFLQKNTSAYLRTSFFPHCLMQYPELTENYEISQDEQRKEFALNTAHSNTNDQCIRCKRFSACRGLPAGYKEVEVFPFL